MNEILNTLSIPEVLLAALVCCIGWVILVLEFTFEISGYLASFFKPKSDPVSEDAMLGNGAKTNNPNP